MLGLKRLNKLCVLKQTGVQLKVKTSGWKVKHYKVATVKEERIPRGDGAH